MKQVIVMRAIPGSGKSTFAKMLCEKFQSEGKSCIICSADDYFTELGGGSYKFDPSKIPVAHGSCFKKFIKALNDGIDVVIVDNTNLSSWEISPYKLAADAYDYEFVIKQVNVDQEAAFKRQQHGVPEVGHKRMHKALKNENLLPWWEKEEYESSEEDGKPAFKRMANFATKLAQKYGFVK